MARQIPPTISSQAAANPSRAFYLKDSISRTMPGKADTMVVRKSGEAKRTETKRHLTMTVAEVYALFKAEHPDHAVGKSKFFELRPKHVLPSSKTPQNLVTC